MHQAYSVLTGAAKPGEGQLTALHMTAAALLSIRAQGGGDADLRHINNAVAAGANKVDMGIGVGIESLNAVYGADADDLTLFLKECQIPVYRCLRDIGMFLLQHLVYHLSGGVGVRIHQTF